MPRPPAAERNAAHWRRLGLIPGAPECVLKAAHRAQIEQHHPDRGGDPEAAKRVNVAYDELRGSGSLANEYVATNYNAEPWVILGITNAADPALAARAGKQLIGELRAHPRLAARVEWAVANFETARAAVNHRPRVAPLTPPPPPRRTTPERSPHRPPAEPAKPGVPEGLPPKVDFGKLQWGATAARTIKLTWTRFAPYEISVDAAAPLRAQVTASKVLPGRFSIELSVDWSSPELAGGPGVRGYTLDAAVTVRWAGGGEITVPARGLILYPALVSASPPSADLGVAEMSQAVRASIVLVSSAPAEITVEPPAWLRRVDGSGRVLDAPLKLATDVPVRVEFRVHWPPIAERAAPSFESGRPVRPTGRIVVRWDGRELEVPVQMVVHPPRVRAARRA